MVRAGPLQTQSDDVLAMLADPARCRVMLVTLPEETPVNEVVERRPSPWRTGWASTSPRWW